MNDDGGCFAILLMTTVAILAAGGYTSEQYNKAVDEHSANIGMCLESRESCGEAVLDSVSYFGNGDERTAQLKKIYTRLYSQPYVPDMTTKENQ